MVSIHAPAWGATLSLCQFMAREEVSIHAPAWGATTSIMKCLIKRRSFNPRTRMGCDKLIEIGSLWVFKFQSTHPHGVRQNSVLK